MKFIFIGIAAFTVIAAIAALILWRVCQKNVKDKGGMENPFRTDETTTSVREENTDKTSEE